MAQRANQPDRPMLLDRERERHRYPRTALPQPLTSLVGRTQETAFVAALFEQSVARLVTLTGTGGIGKTRLALRVVEHLQARFPDGVWFISLASIADPNLVIPAITRALGVAEDVNQPMLDRLVGYIRERQALLVLDNFEHVVDASAGVAELLAVCPELAALITSRAPLRLSGEYEYPVPPLGCDSSVEYGDSSVLDDDAVRLFVERASFVSPGFSLTTGNTPVVLEICRRLDGVPLALELAAARIKMLAPEDLLERLDQPLSLLTGGPRDAPARQQTMHDTLQWSYDLLTSDEQHLFRQLSVFAGGCTLTAVEAISKQERAFGTLSSLVDKSLVRRVDRPGQATRYEMLEPVRQFASDRLREQDDEGASVRQQHARFFLSIVEGLNERLDRPEGPAVFEQIESEHDNLRAALRWLRESGQVELGLELISELGIFWHQHGYISEGRVHAEAFLSSPGAARRTIERARALWSASWLWLYRGENEAALLMNDEARAIAEEYGDRSTLARALFTRGNCHFRRGDDRHAESDWERALLLFRELENAPMIVRVLVHLGAIARRQGDLDRSRTVLEEALALARAGDLKMVLAPALGALGTVAEQSGNDEWAINLCRERLALYHELGIRWGIASTIEHIACLVHRQRHEEGATCLFGFVSVYREQYGSNWYHLTHNTNLDAELGALRSALPDAVFQAAWERGRAMSVEDAVEFALEGITASHSEPVSKPPDVLTPREVEVLRLIAAGRSNREMAEDLYLSQRTIERHIANIYLKIDVHNRTEAARYAFQHHLGDMPTM